MAEKIYSDYFFDKTAFDTIDRAYIPLEVPNVPENKLKVAPLLKPDKETETDIYYTVTAQAGETQILPGPKTKTWGYNNSILVKRLFFLTIKKFM
jgi:hypothetical protein